MRRLVFLLIFALAKGCSQASAGAEEVLPQTSVLGAAAEELVCLGQAGSATVFDNASRGAGEACTAVAAEPAALPSQRRVTSKAHTLAELAEENDWKNDVVLFWLPQHFREKLPRVVHSWLRNYVAVLALYFAVGGVWSYYIYWCFGAALFGPGKMPGMPDVLEQVKAR